MEPKLVRFALLLAGVTASGKSALAIKRAKQNNALIINADSMQIYDVLNVLSARPQLEELAQAEHALYGIIHPSIRFSTGDWLRAVEALINNDDNRRRDLIFVGGTGLYFKALIDGFTNVPAVPEKIVKSIEQQVFSLNKEERIALLKSADPLMAERLLEPDRQRLVRALSVLKATGKSLSYWQQQKQSGLLNGFEVEHIVLSPDKELLNKRIEHRFNNMLNQGAIDEVKSLIKLKLDNSLPAMKAIGVKQISSWLAGDITKEKAIELSVIATRQYAKRQRTWFRKWS